MKSLQGEIINQITDDIYSYDYTDRLFIMSSEIDHDKAEDLQRFLRNQNKKWLQILAPCWPYRIPQFCPYLYIKWGMGCYFYSEINSDDSQCKIVLSLLLNELINSLTCQQSASKYDVAPVAPSSRFHTLIGSGNQDFTPSKLHTTTNITAIKWKISNL